VRLEEPAEAFDQLQHLLPELSDQAIVERAAALDPAVEERPIDRAPVEGFKPFDLVAAGSGGEERVGSRVEVAADEVERRVGVGFAPPAASWGVMLQEATNIRAIADFPWLLSPAVAIIAVVLGLVSRLERR
jgi:hypothetical protein